MTLIIENNLLGTFDQSHFKIKKFKIGSILRRLTNITLNAGTFYHKDKSSSFRFRIQRKKIGDYFTPNDKTNKYYIKIKKVFLLSFYVFSNKFIYFLITNIYTLSITRMNKLSKALMSEDFDHILIWNQTLDPALSFSIKNARKRGIVSTVIADNWDNVSSKSIMIDKPDYLICFGEQTKNLATRIHSLPKDRVLPFGAARLDNFQITNKSSGRKFVLFAGSSIALEDYEVLQNIENFRKNLPPLILNQIRWVYRPHPYPQGASINYLNFKTQFSDWEFSSPENSSQVWGDLESLQELLNQCVAAVCMPTSLILEARFLNVPVILPLFESSKVRSSAKVLVRELEHLKELPQLEGIEVVNNFTALSKILNEIIVLKSYITSSKALKLNYFLGNTNKSFRDQIREHIDRFI